MDIKGYNCSHCGGIVLFDIATQMAKCQSCGAVFTRAELAEHHRYDDDTFDCAAASGGHPQGTGAGDATDEDMFDCAVASVENSLGADVDATEDENSFECAAGVAEDGAFREDLETDDLTTGACPACGAELYGDQNTVAMVCPCCGNAQIIEKRISSIMKPDYIIPFKRDKSAVQEAFAEFCEGRRLLPDTFKTKSRVEGIQGVYVPFWLFDGLADGWVMYEATKKVSTGKNSETHYYSVEREGSLAFENLPVDGSEKMDDKYMDSIEPFDYREMQTFDPSYLAGYTAEKYDVDAEKCKPRALKRVKKTAEKKFQTTVVNYDSVTTICSSIKIKNASVSYALFPVWVLNTKYDNEKYIFMMNGQTGKMAGKLPVDEGKLPKYKAICTGIIGLIFTAIFYLGLMWLDHIELIDGAASSPIAISVIAISSLIGAARSGSYIVSEWEKEMNTVALRKSASEYAVPGSLKCRKMKDKYDRRSGGLVFARPHDDDEWMEDLREAPPEIADPNAESLRRKSDDIGPWTESVSRKMPFYEVELLTEHKKSSSSDDW